MNGSYGEIVEVEGGHIVRSTGKKDRHSKVCTAKGPRDRRVRLSAPTAIQFYDVQDRLGFDRPSKAVDWLINNAKSSIDDLEKLPPWNPIDTLRQHHHASNSKPRKSKTRETEQREKTEHGETEHHHEESSFLPASMDSDSIADTIKSFFPAVSSGRPPPQSYHHQPYQSQDLRLSLQSFANQTEQPALFSNQSSFDSTTTSWDGQQSLEFGRIQRLVTLNNGGGGFVFASPASIQPVYGQSQVFSQRGPLQSMNTPMIRACFDPHQSITTYDHHPPYHNRSAIPGIAFASNGEFTGFRIPARFQGEEDGENNKPSSASSDSRH